MSRDRVEMLFPWWAINLDDLDRSGVTLACHLERKRFFRSEVELMGYYQRGQPPPRDGYKLYFSVDRAGDPVVVAPLRHSLDILINTSNFRRHSVSTRFSGAWRPWQVRDGLWFWGVA